MSKCRSISNQIKGAISLQHHPGQLKHSASREHKQDRIFGNDRVVDLYDRADQFGHWIEINHREIKWIKNITTEHVREWLVTLENVRGTTIDEYNGQLGKIHRCCVAAYHLRGAAAQSWQLSKAAVREIGGTRDLLRTVTMTRADHSALLSSMKATNRSAVWLSLELSARSGLRVNECAHLKGSDIHLETGKIHVCKEGAKGGRVRDIPIFDRDRAFYAGLKKRVGQGWVFPSWRGGHLSRDSLNDRIRDHMHKIGIADKYDKTTIHSVRKLYAQERMAELRIEHPQKS